MNLKLSTYILYSSVFAIFSEAFFVNYIIDWKLFYLIIFTNYIGLIYLHKYLKINRYFVYILLFFIIHGLLTYTIIGIPPNYMLSQIIGISIVGLYFYNFVRLYKVEDIINVYLKISLLVCILGYPMYFFDINYNDGRFNSIFKEPAHFAIVVLPACYYYWRQKEYLKFLIIFFSVIFSNSSLGFIGLGLLFLLPNFTFKRLKAFAIILPITITIFYLIYSQFSFFKMRIDETYMSLKVINTGKFHRDTNVSSYALIANLYSAKENFIEHPLGSGIGSHFYMHTQRNLKTVRPPEYIRTLNIHTINSFDANSLATRLFSEFGIFGIISVFGFIIFGITLFIKPKNYFTQGLFVYFLLKLFRDGTYFPPEFYLFIWLFYFIYNKPKIESLN